MPPLFPNTPLVYRKSSGDLRLLHSVLSMQLASQTMMGWTRRAECGQTEMQCIQEMHLDLST